VIGVGEGFEIWSAAGFDEAADEEQEEYAQALESLARVHLSGPV
jgi:DNA-binding transcriptional regulator/RsmH inhibitor MraZ